MAVLEMQTWVAETQANLEVVLWVSQKIWKRILKKGCLSGLFGAIFHFAEGAEKRNSFLENSLVSYLCQKEEDSECDMFTNDGNMIVVSSYISS